MNYVRILSCLLLLSLTCTAKQAPNKKINLDEAARAYGLSTATGTAGLATAQYTHPIVPAQINNTGYYAVKDTGYYFLTEDLFFSPRYFVDNAVELATTKAIIYIQKDNVIVDLNSKTITAQNNKSGAYLDIADVHAIHIQDGTKNVTIKNGTINFVTGNGINIGKNCKNITLSNIQIINCGTRGISAQGDSDNKIQGLTIENCNVSNCSGTIKPNATLYGDTTHGHAVGIDLNYVESSFITDTISSNNQINVTVGETNSSAMSVAAGICLQNCQNIICKDCMASNNAAPTAQGFFIIGSGNLTFEGCKADENHARCLVGSITTTVADGIGFHLKGSSYCNFENCQANHNHATTRYGIGFYLDGTSDSGRTNFNSFSNCVAMSNQGGSIAAITAYTVENDCEEVLSGPNPILGITSIGAGFLSYGKDNDNYNTGNSIVNSLAKGNMCDAEVSQTDPLKYNKALGIGFLYEDGSIIQGCKCIGNGNHLSTDTVTVSSPGGDLEVPHVLGYGIYLGPTGLFEDETSTEYTTMHYTYTKNIVISECWLMFNSRAGLRDDAKDCQSLIMRNYAFRNGTQNNYFSQGDLSLYASNYQVQYLQPNEKLTLTTATVGGFGALNVANPYANIEWQVSDTSYGHWDSGESPTTLDSID